CQLHSNWPQLTF
nr:immunoglobulin light chain junction region [Macaca mulatta]